MNAQHRGLGPQAQKFAELTASFSRPDWLRLGALACERKLSEGVMESILVELGQKATSLSLRSWLAANLERGLVVDAGMMQVALPARGMHPERAFAIAPAFRAIALRALGAARNLEALRSATRTVLGERSASTFVSALYCGDLAALERALVELNRKVPSGEQLAFANAMLHEALTSAFDADWLERCWGDAALDLGERVLQEALGRLEPVDGLYGWACERALAGSRESILRVLAEHALLRGDSEKLRALAAKLPTSEALAFDALAAYLDGDLARAYARLDDGTARYGSGDTAPAHCVSVVVLLALLALSRDPQEGSAFTRRLLRKVPPSPTPLVSGASDASAVTVSLRALRALVRDLTQPTAERAMPIAHQLAANAPAWELMLLALSVHLHQEAPVPRAAWARRVRTSSARWLESGYLWLARQARTLAAALDATPSEELEPSSEEGRTAAHELTLVSLIEPEPEWQKALKALAAFTESSEKPVSVLARRACFFVDTVNVKLSKPALEEFKSGSGWARRRRLEVGELVALEHELPAEDRRVLRAVEELAGHYDFTVSAFEALIGHPRVFNAARSQVAVEVVPGTSRVETRREHGHLIVHVEPAGAVEGVNVTVDGDARVIVYRVSAALAKLTELLPSGLRIPLDHAQQVLPILGRLAEHVEVKTQELPAHRNVDANDTPCLRISPEAGAFLVELGVRPFGERGRFFPTGLGRAKLSSYNGGEMLETERHFEQEEQRLDQLVARCPTLAAAIASANEDGHDGPYSLAFGEEELFSLLVELRDSTLEHALEWKNSRPIASFGSVTASSLRGQLRSLKGWYVATGSFPIDQVNELALAELVTLPFTKSGRFIRLPSGDFVEVERRIRQVLSTLAAHAERDKRGPKELRLPKAAFALLRSLGELDSGFEVAPEVRAWLSEVDSAFEREEPLPPGLQATLRAYQSEGFQWLYRMSALGLGVCLADDMGLGKTLQILALLLQRAAGGPALVVAPTSVCGNWLEEIARFAPSLRAREYAGKDRAKLLLRLRGEAAPDGSDEPVPELVITSYALLQQDAEELSSVEWHTAVLDEAQFIKNAHSLRAKAAFALNARYRVAATGTPVENHLGDLWSIFHFLNESLLGSWKHFQHRYLNPIERDGDSERRAALKSLLQPFLLRRTKDQVLRELPPLTSVRHEVELSEDETLRYALLRRQIHDKLFTTHGKRNNKLQVFAEITRLRRFCCHPRLVFPMADHASSKIEAFLELVEELRQNQHRALVFSQFVDFLELVREQLAERGIDYLYLDGSTPKEVRRANIARFQAGETDLFLISLKAGGFGINLTGADYVIHLDPWWNPAVEAQATDRAHRIGQDKPVTVYHLITKHTIEERIVELHREKRQLADGILEGSDAATAISLDDLRQLIE